MGIMAVSFGYQDYHAVLLPGYGANLISLQNKKLGVNFLRTLKSDEDKTRFTSMPVLYGTPVLFPPNRIEGGTFHFNGKTYHFPINEPSRNNAMHGFLHDQPWIVTEKSMLSDCTSLTAVFIADRTTSFFKYFPHTFNVTLVYTLSDKGLSQKISIRNTGTEPMPLGLGFHTAFQIPFLEHGDPKDYTLFLSADNKWIMKNLLPAGPPAALSLEEQNLFLKTGLLTQNHPVVCQHYSTRKRPMPFNLELNGAIIADTAQKVFVAYDWDDPYSFAMLWNGDGASRFFCAEPQSWVVNAPNVPLDASQTGLRTLQPNQTWHASTRIYASKYT